jgi:hypothetical protein
MTTARSVVRDLENEWAGVVGKRRMMELKETLGELMAVLEEGHTINGACHE